jgi:hypothetical protein
MKTSDIAIIVIATTLLVIVGVAAVVIIEFHQPDSDSTTLIASILGFVGPTVAALLAVIKGLENSKEIAGVKSDLQSNTEVTKVAAAAATEAVAAVKPQI